jgi:hypothetical protein
LSLDLDSSFLHDPAPSLDVSLDHGKKLLGRAAGGRHAIRREPVRHFFQLQNLVEFAIDAIEDRLRQVPGCDQAVTLDGLIAREAGFGDGREFRRRIDAFGRADGNAFHGIPLIVASFMNVALTASSASRYMYGYSDLL